ncbi:MAG: hypothetical protein JSV63_02045 [Candidatus Aenigmatarchaeota archaeon]|nr:MAG: hypothetical protein JSV63_02045 [Candidatus Aenigmarchaeota archaeon]
MELSEAANRLLKIMAEHPDYNRSELLLKALRIDYINQGKNLDVNDARRAIEEAVGSGRLETEVVRGEKRYSLSDVEET